MTNSTKNISSVETGRCPKCSATVPIEEIRHPHLIPKRRNSWCKNCRRLSHKAWREANPEAWRLSLAGHGLRKMAGPKLPKPNPPMPCRVCSQPITSTSRKRKLCDTCRDDHSRASAVRKSSQRAWRDRNETERWLREIKEETPCADCHRSFPHFVMDFDHSQGDKLGGVGHLRSRLKWGALRVEITKCELVCAACHRVRTHPNANSTKVEPLIALKRFIAYGLIKVHSVCADCQGWYPGPAMDFDHVRGEKKLGVATLVKNRSSLVTLLLEIDKCDLVCVNCHRIRTYGRFYPEAVVRWRAKCVSLSRTTSSSGD
jgi:hypothetical protein